MLFALRGEHKYSHQTIELTMCYLFDLPPPKAFPLFNILHVNRTRVCTWFGLVISATNWFLSSSRGGEVKHWKSKYDVRPPSG